MRVRKLKNILAAALGTACLLAGCGGREPAAPPVSSASPTAPEAEESAEPSTSALSIPVEGGSLRFDAQTGEIIGWDGAVTGAEIPDEYGGAAVRSVKADAFKNCGSLTSVYIPDSVAKIGDSAFRGCGALAEARLPAGLDVIEPRLFRECVSLRRIDIPEGVTDIGYEAFYGCSSLEGLVIPDGVERLEPGAFSDCVSLSELTVPGSVLSVDYEAFSGCAGLRELTIEDGVEEIWDYAFRDCAGLRTVSLPASLKEMGEYPFHGCESLVEITADLGNGAFVSLDGVLFDRELTQIAVWPEGALGENLVMIPDALTGDGQPEAASSADRPDVSVLKDENVRVVPLYEAGDLYGDLFFLLPPDRRAAGARGADYALVETLRYENRSDYVYSGTEQKAPASDAVTTLYLCAPDGSYTQLYSVKKAPPSSGSSLVGLHGERASADELWEGIAELF